MGRRIVILSYDFGGENIHSREIMERKLARDGRADATVLYINWSPKREHITLSDRIQVEALRARFPKSRPLYDLLFIFFAPKIVSDSGFKPDEILISDFSLVWAAMRVRARVGGRVILQLNGLPHQLAATRGFVHFIYYRLNEKFTARFVDTFVAINETTQRYLIELGVPSDHVEVRAPNVIRADMSFIQSAVRGRVRDELRITHDTPILLAVGRLEPEKTFDELLHLFATASIDTRLIIVGEGKLHDSLQKLTDELGIRDRVFLVGHKDRSKIWNYYRDADAFALISKSEGLGLVLWEAMYAGVPVIGRPVGGIKETIGEDGLRGFFWDTPNGAAAFGEKLERCFKKEHEVQEMVERAKVYVKSQLGIVDV
ncbi:MAG TPA: glycosyltransferase [Candidatus Paceibacterota bacterium]|nr:glycosyltransferase [Candidatus Paceibacterota bacterium]